MVFIIMIGEQNMVSLFGQTYLFSQDEEIEEILSSEYWFLFLFLNWCTCLPTLGVIKKKLIPKICMLASRNLERHNNLYLV